MMENTKVSQLQHQVWVSWHEVQDLLIRCEDITFSGKVGIQHQQFIILMTMASFNGPVTETALAQKARRNINSISTIIDRMQKEGLVKRARDKKDRRVTRLTMTELGKEMLASGVKNGWNLIQNVTKPFTEAELQESLRLLNILKAQACKELGQEPDPAESETVNEEKFNSMMESLQNNSNGHLKAAVD